MTPNQQNFDRYPSTSSMPRLRKLSRSISAVSLVAFLLLASLAIWHGSQGAVINLLVNSGFEDSTGTGWTTFGNALIESTNNAYYNGGVDGGSNVVARTGAFTFKTFGQASSAGGNTVNGAYQDVPAAPGSTWSASGYALTHKQDLISGANSAWLEVSFRNANDAALATYRSGVINASTLPISWVRLQATNQIDVRDNSTVIGRAASFIAPNETVKIRYQLIFRQPSNTDGGSVYFDDLDLTRLGVGDPEITSLPSDVSKPAGQTATFSVAATGSATVRYQWKKNGVNLANTGNLSGVSTPTLNIANVNPVDAGNYSVVIADTIDAYSVSANLTVLSSNDQANYLGNPGFETGSFSPWINYGFSAIHSTNDFYEGATARVNAHSGIRSLQTYNGGGEYNGVYQDIPVNPGDTFAADGWALTPAVNPLFGGNVAWIEVTFRNVNGDVLGLNVSPFITANNAASTWTSLPVNTQISASDGKTVLGSSTTFTAPPGATFARYQIVNHSTTGTGSVIFDDLKLVKAIPGLSAPSLLVARSGANVNLSFSTKAGFSYQVLFKDNLTDATWQSLTTVSGDGSIKSVAVSPSTTRRFYRVGTQ